MTPAPYHPPAWLPGGHAQTVWPLAIKPARPAARRERWTTPDGDFIDVDWSGEDADAPLLVLFHGLEGSAGSHYATTLVPRAQRQGYRCVLPHFRGCSGVPNLAPRAYHSGDWEEIDWILRRLRAAQRGPMFAVGVSLGGSALLNWLGRMEDSAADILVAAAAVSTPLDLAVAGRALEVGFSKLYTAHFLRTLKPNALAKLARHPGLYDPARVRAARTLYDFDDTVTAPIHGFRGALDYWTRASSRPWLPAIRLPTLVLNARNDPFLPAHALPTQAEVSPAVRLEQPGQGGHVGFVTGPFPGRLDWLPQRLLAWFATGA